MMQRRLLWAVPGMLILLVLSFAPALLGPGQYPRHS